MKTYKIEVWRAWTQGWLQGFGESNLQVGGVWIIPDYELYRSYVAHFNKNEHNLYYRAKIRK